MGQDKAIEMRAAKRNMEGRSVGDRKFVSRWSIEELLQPEKLDALAALHERYVTASPFPHIVIDDFFDETVVQSLASDFPGPQDHAWLRYKARFQNDKLQSTSELSMPLSIRDMIAALNSSTFVRFLESLTGIQGIVPDPHLYGGGMHQTLRGGHLAVHVDYNRHEQWNLDRRLNVLLYLNPRWEEAWGGALELWDKDVKVCEKRIFPFANRVVIFSTTEFSWHGHPAALACPPDVTRKSLALYYYTNGRPDSEVAPSHNTVFRPVSGEARYISAREVLREFVPPILLRAARLLLRR